MPQIEKIKERFFKKIDKVGTCWNWLGYVWANGYGNFAHLGECCAHRVSYRLFKGDIPKKLVLDHLCRNRKCVNPAHLEIVTRRENLYRGDCPKITKKDANLIKKLYNKGIKQDLLAEKFKINQSEVSRVINGLRWGD